MGEPLEFSVPIDDSKASDAIRSRPGKLTAVAIIAIVLGGFGVLGAVQMTFALTFGKRFQQMQQDSMGSGQAHLQQAIEEMNSSISDVTDRFFVVCVVVAVVGAFLSAGLIYSAARTLRLRESGRRWLRFLFLLTIAFVCSRLIPNIKMQMEMAPIQATYFEALTQPEPGTKVPTGQVTGANVAASMMKMMSFVQMLVLVGWALIVSVLCFVGYAYLGRQEVASLFVTPSQDMIMREHTES